VCNDHDHHHHGGHGLDNHHNHHHSYENRHERFEHGQSFYEGEELEHNEKYGYALEIIHLTKIIEILSLEIIIGKECIK